MLTAVHRPRSGRLLVLLLALLLLPVLLGGCRGATVGQAASAPTKPAGAVEVDRERIAREATWAPGQLRSHFAKHGKEMPWHSEAEYDASARETIRIGTTFTYQDRESDAERLGFYHRESNRFTAVTRDGRRIPTHFRPDGGESYPRMLYRSTYR
jgi:pyocin large subunit-like protein